MSDKNPLRPEMEGNIERKKEQLRQQTGGQREQTGGQSAATPYSAAAPSGQRRFDHLVELFESTPKAPKKIVNRKPKKPKPVGVLEDIPEEEEEEEEVPISTSRHMDEPSTSAAKPEPSVRPKTKFMNRPTESIETPGVQEKEEWPEGYQGPAGSKPYDLAIRQGIAKNVVVPDDLVFVKHKVSPQYRQYVQSGDINDLPARPFGFTSSLDPSDNNSDIEERAIEGPPNYSQIWSTWKTIGADFKEQIPLFGPPLNRDQLAQLQDWKEEIRKVDFIQVIGKGSYGQVWSVRVERENARTNTTEISDMACKVMRLKEDRSKPNKNAVDSLLADIRILQNLKHENIVGFIDMIGIPDKKTRFPYAVVLMLMELCDGDLIQVNDLASAALRGGVLPENYCRIWFRHVCEGLKYMHSRNVVHMDIKPGNILCVYNNRAMKNKRFEVQDMNDMTFKLADFGLSIAYPMGEPCVLDTTHRNIGTRIYMSPEMETRYEPLIDTKANDIHCLGKTLAVVKLGKVTVKAVDFESTLDRIVNQNHSPDVYNITTQLADIVFHMTRRDSENRLTIAQVLDHQWLKAQP